MRQQVIPVKGQQSRAAACARVQAMAQECEVVIRAPNARRISGIYGIKSITSGMVYVGSSNNIGHRWSQHKSLLRRGIHQNGKLQNSWNKYGDGDFVFYIIEIVENDSEILGKEQSYINSMRCVEDGFNLSSVAGRERLGARHTKESIEKMSNSHKGKEISKIHREKLSKAFKGRQFSEETRRKISESKIGKKRPPITEETRRRLSEAGMGRRMPQETKDKLSVIRKADAAKKREIRERGGDEITNI